MNTLVSRIAWAPGGVIPMSKAVPPPLETGKSHFCCAQNLFLRLRQTDGIDGVVDSTVGELPNRFKRLGLFRIDRVGSAEAPCKSDLFLGHKPCNLMTGSDQRRREASQGFGQGTLSRRS
jgi:hypothetical protein